MMNEITFIDFLWKIKDGYCICVSDRVKDYMEMKNDLAKSILDIPYNRVESGRKIELSDILDKY